MNIGEFIIKIGTQGNTKGLDEAIKKLEEAEKKTRKMIKVQQALTKATSDEEKALIKKNAAQQDELDNLKAVKTEHDALNNTIQKNIATTLKFIGVAAATITMLDRMGNSLLKSNQQYITFEKQTGISINRLNRMAGIARMSGMNLSPEQVASDLQSIQQKVYEYGLGKGTGIFSQLRMNPMGMQADQFIAVLRQKLKPYSGQVKSNVLSQLGLSQEWLNVIDLTDEKFKEYLKTSKELQLSDKERYLLAKYTEKQQKNNMRWELAKQKITIAILPYVQEIMEATSKIALKIADIFEKNPAWLNLAKDVLLLLAGRSVIKTIEAIAGLLKLGGITTLLGIGGAAAKTGAGVLARGGIQKGATKVGLATAGKIPGWIGILANAALFVPLIYDAIKGFFNKQDKAEDELQPEPVEQARYQYHNIESKMTNNFFANPQPAQTTINELNNAINRYTQYQYR